IAVDSAGNAYVTGYTDSSDFPTANAMYGTNTGNVDAFVTKIGASGTSLSYSTYLGGSGDDYGYDMAVDSAGNAYVTGYTDSSDFPTANAMYGTNTGNVDAFVTKIGASGTSLSYSTYLGGSGDDYGYDMAVDSAGNAYVTGYTDSSDFPTANAMYGTNTGNVDAFVTKIGASGTSLSYSTYLGGSGDDYGYDMAVDSAGNAYVTGYTDSSDFPTANAMYGTNTGKVDAFVAKIGADATPTPTPTVTPTPGTPTPTPTVTPTPNTPTPAPTITPVPGTPIPTLTVTPTPGTPTPTPTVTPAPGTPTPTPTPSPTPEPCKPKKLNVRPKSLKLTRETSVQKTVTLTCNGGLPSGNQPVAIKIMRGKKLVNVSPAEAYTNGNGQATFTITATEKTGNAVVRFKYKNLTDDVTVKVR
ncbi:SBBP repeat-containing protein, partial [Candidatus Brocadia sapporoensis]|uniref:SBBP repeat-containing protein n=1 Tax=Candidatus Brocadia sapporoensis TaxID=392547 RepID=UPI000AF43C7C